MRLFFTFVLTTLSYWANSQPAVVNHQLVCGNFINHPNQSIEFSTFGTESDTEFSAHSIQCLAGECETKSWEIVLKVYLVGTTGTNYPYTHLVEFSFHDFDGDCIIDLINGGYGLPQKNRQQIYITAVKEIADFLKDNSIRDDARE